jgi:hypothetical protein
LKVECPVHFLPPFGGSIRVWYLDIRQYWDSNDELSLKAEFSPVLRHLKQPFTRRQKLLCRLQQTELALGMLAKGDEDG